MAGNSSMIALLLPFDHSHYKIRHSRYTVSDGRVKVLISRNSLLKVLIRRQTWGQRDAHLILSLYQCSFWRVFKAAPKATRNSKGKKSKQGFEITPGDRLWAQLLHTNGGPHTNWMPGVLISCSWYKLVTAIAKCQRAKILAKGRAWSQATQH